MSRQCRVIAAAENRFQRYIRAVNALINQDK